MSCGTVYLQDAHRLRTLLAAPAGCLPLLALTHIAPCFLARHRPLPSTSFTLPAGPRLLRLIALLAFNAKGLASGLDALSSLGVFACHLATAKSGTVQCLGQAATRSPLQLKYELLAQVAEVTTLPMGISYLGVLAAAPTDQEDDASLDMQRTSYSGGWWVGVAGWGWMAFECRNV